jgi:hypothetical protein
MTLSKLQKHTYHFSSHTEFEEDTTNLDPCVAYTNTEIENMLLAITQISVTF